MSEQEALVAAIAASPGDDLPRLVFADWLEEHGEPGRAEFIRAQCELERLPLLGPRYYELAARVRELFAAGGPAWVRRFVGGEPDPDASGNPFSPFGLDDYDPWGVVPKFDLCGGFGAFEFTRGFVGGVRVAAYRPGLRVGFADLFRVEPVTRLKVTLQVRDRAWPGLSVPCLLQIRHLTLDLLGGWSDAEDVEAVAAIFDDPNLSGLTGFHLLGDMPDFGPRSTLPSRLVERVLASPRLAAIRDLGLTLRPRELELLAASTARPEAFTLNDFDPLYGAADLVCRLPFRDRLIELDLKHDSLGDYGVRRLANEAWPRLERLDLSCNSVGDAGVEALTRAEFVPRLKRLRLGLNEITDDGAIALAHALDPEVIEVLDLRENPIADAGYRELRRLGGAVRFGKTR